MNHRIEIEIKDGRTRKRIRLPCSPKKTDSSSGIGKCKHCHSPYRIAVSFMAGRSGFCGKKCKRSFFRREKKLRNEKNRKYRQSRHHINNNALHFYESREWRDIRYVALRKFGFACLACGRKPPEIILHVDHIKPRSKFPELSLDPENLQVLCEDCNLGKSNRYKDDFRR